MFFSLLRHISHSKTQHKESWQGCQWVCFFCCPNLLRSDSKTAFSLDIFSDTPLFFWPAFRHFSRVQIQTKRLIQRLEIVLCYNIADDKIIFCCTVCRASSCLCIFPILFHPFNKLCKYSFHTHSCMAANSIVKGKG